MKGMLNKMRVATVIPLILMMFLFMPCGVSDAGEVDLSRGQTLYVPVYSSVLFGDRPLEYHLAVTLSVRNTDMRDVITLTGVDYYGTDGSLLQAHLKEPLDLPPLAATSIFIREQDISGGLGASFIVEWEARNLVSTPIVECIMIGTKLGQGISFVNRGKVVKGKKRRYLQPVTK